MQRLILITIGLIIGAFPPVIWAQSIPISCEDERAILRQYARGLSEHRGSLEAVIAELRVQVERFMRNPEPPIGAGRVDRAPEKEENP